MRQFIIGTDWWTDCDDAVAMRILARAALAGKIRILGIGMNACMEHSVPSLDAFLHLEGLDNIPISIDLEANDFGRNPPYQKRLAASAFRFHKNEEVGDAVRMYRKLLSEAQEPVEIIEVGYPQVLANLLESPGDDISPETGLELMQKKVRKLWMMAGKWDVENGRENNFARNARSIRGADILLRKCPVPITFLGWEVGADVLTGGELPKDDFLYLTLVDHGSPNGRCSWDPMLAVMALTGDEQAAGYDTVSGTARVHPETGLNSFTPSPDGMHKYVVRRWEPARYQQQINALIR